MDEKTKLKFLSCFLVVALLVGLAIPASAASQSDPWTLIWQSDYDPKSFRIGDTNTYVPYYSYSVMYPDSQGISSWYYAIFNQLQWINSDTSYLRPIAETGSYIFNRLGSINTVLHSDLQTISSTVSSIKSFLAPAYKQTLETNQQDNIEQVTDDFFSGDQSSSSLGTSDFSDLKDFTSEAGVMLSSPVDPSQFSSSLSTALSSNGGLGFFSSSVRDDLQPPSVELQGESEVVYLDFLSPLISEVDSLVGAQNG